MKTKLLFMSGFLAIIAIAQCYGQTDEIMLPLELNSESEFGVDLNLNEFTSANFLTSTDNPTTITVEGLSEMRTVVLVYEGSKNAGMNIPGFGDMKLGKTEANVNVYYVETKIVGDTAVYGIGYSVHYLFKRVKKGINILNLPNVSASVQLDNSRSQVLYSLQTYGMIGRSLRRYFKPVVNKDFNVEGFGIMQSSMDGIENVMSDTTLSKTIRYTPMRLKFIKPSDLN
jgi:hypothetical protein